MPLSKARNRQRIDLIQRNFRVKVDYCNACHRIAPVHRHHLDYDKPLILKVCAACHKKIHLIQSGQQRTKFNPYINPLQKLPIDTDGNVIPDYE